MTSLRQENVTTGTKIGLRGRDHRHPEGADRTLQWRRFPLAPPPPVSLRDAQLSWQCMVEREANAEAEGRAEDSQGQQAVGLPWGVQGGQSRDGGASWERSPLLEKSACFFSFCPGPCSVLVLLLLHDGSFH